MSSTPGSPGLQQLHRLDQSSPDFPNQLYNALRAKEYVQCEQNLTGGDLTWLIDYLDKVRRHVTLPHSPLRERRLSVLSILPAQIPGGFYVNSEISAAPGWCSQLHSPFRLTFYKSTPNRLLLEVLVMCTREPSMVRQFASNVSGCISNPVHKILPKFVIDTVSFTT